MPLLFADVVGLSCGSSTCGFATAYFFSQVLVCLCLTLGATMEIRVICMGSSPGTNVREMDEEAQVSTDCPITPWNNNDGIVGMARRRRTRRMKWSKTRTQISIQGDLRPGRRRNVGTFCSFVHNVSCERLAGLHLLSYYKTHRAICQACFSVAPLNSTGKRHRQFGARLLIIAKSLAKSSQDAILWPLSRLRGKATQPADRRA